MVFSSILFLLHFLPIFLLVYHFAADRYKNLVALIASVGFYAWGAPKFVFIALLSIFIDYFIVATIARSSAQKRLLFLWFSVILNVGLLLYYKYANFFIENTNYMLSSLGIESLEWTAILLPIGISFYTFQKLSYSIDVYRNVRPPLKRLEDYTLYILLFPQLIAGPIVRFNEIAEQLLHREYRNYDDRIYGIYRFSIGLAKKVLIANVLGAKADLVFSFESAELNASTAWFGILCYTFQIYFDFSGYSDMAIGLGRLMGFKFPENFNSPYISQNITEFWRRWHITLGNWMRDYLYIPLGGNRVKSNFRLYFNLWVVFLISGFWHGAAWNFVLWGAYHGAFLIADRLFLNKLTRHIGKWGRIALTFFVVIIGWVLFRADDATHAGQFIKTMLSFNFQSLGPIVDVEAMVMLLFGFFLGFASIHPMILNRYNSFVDSVSVKNAISKVSLSLVLLLLSIAAIAASSFNPFIYFRF